MIKILDKQIYELIAAGEVIERPASVVKELVENSIDAGATRVTVEIKGGGTALLRVSDNGCGMSFRDVPIAFLRHATSKITSKEDIDNVKTLGFRGEALASVCAVSHAEIFTKSKNDNLGTRYKISASVEEIHEETGCADGTSVIIRDLFYNVPARKKFLKKDGPEGAAVISIVEKIALSHPHIAFNMLKDGNIEWSTSGDGKLYSAIYALYGKTFADDLLYVSYNENDIKVEGYAVKPLYSLYRRTRQNFFVNGRYVHSFALRNALEEAYESLIMRGKFPACVLMIEMPPNELDVNIHPQKSEVRFANEQKIKHSVYFAIKNAFVKNGLIYSFQQPNDRENRQFFRQPTFEKPAETIQETFTLPAKESLYTNCISNFTNEEKSNIAHEMPPSIYEEIVDIRETISEENAVAIASKVLEQAYIKPAIDYQTPSFAGEFAEQNSNEIATIFSEIRVIGEFSKNYIIVEITDNSSDYSLLIIDKHAAHERVIYEKLKEKSEITSQNLLLPYELFLTEDEFENIRENAEELKKIGFETDFSVNKKLKIMSIPSFLEHSDIDSALDEIVNNVKKGKFEPQTAQYDELLHSIACKAAIKSGDMTNINELQYLAQEVVRNPNIRHCPHGRPILFHLTRNEIEKKFRRII